MHPYEMGLLLRQRHKEESIKLRYGSLYTVIDLLLSRGFIVERETGRDGRRPKRTIYELTPAGSAELHAWMTDLIGEPIKEYPQFEAALCLLPVLPPDEALALLRRRLELIDENSAALVRQMDEAGRFGVPPLFLIEGEYRQALAKAERQFVAELIHRVENGWGPVALWRALHDDNREATLAKLYSQFGVEPMT